MTAASEPDGLARVLGYQGAVDPAVGVRQLGAELLVVPSWSPSFCRAVVRAAELVGFAPDPDDPVPGHEVPLAAISPGSTRPSRRISAVGSGRSCRRCGR